MLLLLIMSLILRQGSVVFRKFFDRFVFGGLYLSSIAESPTMGPLFPTLLGCVPFSFHIVHSPVPVGSQYGVCVLSISSSRQ